jgi:hypothetical protein
VLTWDDPTAAQLCTFDGRTGHAVTALSADTGGFTFHDPWPGDSLLSAYQNAAGVDAQPIGGEWHITAAELARVVVAAFIFPLLWAEVTGRPGRVSFAALQASEFWAFFHVSETARNERDPARVSVYLKTGGFTEHVAMSMTLSRRGFISTAELRLRQSWLLGPPWGVNPFATDIAAGFLSALTPEADRDRIEPIARTIRGFRMDAANRARFGDQQFLASVAVRGLQAYAGVGADQLTLPMTGSTLSIATESRADEAWRVLRIDSF